MISQILFVCLLTIGSAFAGIGEGRSNVYECDENNGGCFINPTIPIVKFADCPTGWTPLGMSCMQAGDGAVSYQQAGENCAAAGARLVKADGEGLRRLIERNFQGEHWLGLTDRETEGSWVWSDGEPLIFTDGWAPEQPGNGDCVYARGYYFASPCNARRPYICEKRVS